jgi:hypothetical protein
MYAFDVLTYSPWHPHVAEHTICLVMNRYRLFNYPNRLRPPQRAAYGQIIIRHEPSLQGETLTGRSGHERKSSNVAGMHHFLCLRGGGCTFPLGSGSSRSHRPDQQKRKIGGLVWSTFHNFCVNLPFGCLSGKAARQTTTRFENRSHNQTAPPSHAGKR